MRRKIPGYSLMLVIAVLGTLAAAIGVMLTVVTNSSRVTREMVDRRKAFYACDGVQRSVVALGNNYLRSVDAATANGPAMKAFIEGAAGGAGLTALLPPNFSLETFNITFEPATVTNGPLPNGAFQGMNARQTPVNFEVVAKLDTTNVRCGQQMSATLAQIGMFQFLVFSELETSFDAGTGSQFVGRVHSNNDICLQGLGVGAAPGAFDRGPYFSNLTSAQLILHGRDGRCEGTGLSAGNVGIADGLYTDPGTTFLEFKNAADSGCANCDGTGLAWIDYALAEFNGNVRDSAHSVPQLRLPAAAAPVQAGWSARVTSGLTPPNEGINNGLTRFLVDPPRPPEARSIAQQRYACKADIRILDGVWYLKAANPVDGCGWPGQPIWSDHAENAPAVGVGNAGVHEPSVVAVPNDVSQVAIRAALGWPAVPNRYSFYETTATPGNHQITPNATGVVSYGTLFALNPGTIDAIYRPGHYIGAGSPFLTGCAGAAGFRDATTGACLDGSLLNATRSGFKDGHAQVTAPVTPHQRANILPLNFDVNAFQDALADVTPGELGSYFGPVGREFNGIVYITSTWTGSADGFPDAHPTPYPNQGLPSGSAPGALADQTAPTAGTMTFRQNETVPQELCSMNTGLPMTAPASEFVSIACDRSTDRGQVNAVRIINGRNVNFAVLPQPPLNSPGELPEGLTIATNLPYYILGDLNMSADARNPAADKANLVAPWVPVSIAGDQGHLLSNAWLDQRAPWNEATQARMNTRCPTQTTYNTALLTGQAGSRGGAWDGGIHNLPRFLEDWQPRFGCPGGAVAAMITGAFVVGYFPVYADHTYSLPTAAAYSPPIRDWQFDVHLGLIDNQPPGAPIFDVSAVRRWTRF